MELSDPLFLNTMLMAFTAVLTDGYLRVRPWLLNFMASVFGIAMVAGVIVSFLSRWSPVVILMAGSVVLRLAVLAAIAKNWLTVTDGFMNSVVYLGLLIGSNVLTIDDFIQPGRLLLLGLRLAINIWEIAGSWGGDWLWDPLNFGLYTIAMVVTMILFTVLALSVFLGVVEFQLINLWAFLMWPLLSVDAVAWIADGLMRLLAGAALRLGALAGLMSIVVPLSVTIGLPGEGEIDPATGFMMIAGMVILGYVAWNGPQWVGASAIPGRGLITMGLLTWTALSRR